MLQNDLQRNITSACRKLNNQVRASKVSDDETKKAVGEAETGINTKAARGLLSELPDLVEKRGPKVNHGESHGSTGESDIERTPRHTQSKKKLRECCKIEVMSMHPTGPIYAFEQRGSRLVVQINCDHPFYENVVENTPSKHAVYQLLWAFGAAQAKIGASSEEMDAQMANFMEIVSSHIRTLYS